MAVSTNEEKQEYTPKVSVVMPLYNAESHLNETLLSISDQSLREFEVVMVDDGSVDASADIARAKCGEDPRFTLIMQKNSGAASARNNGMAYVRGRYVIFLDADDLFDRNMFRDMVGLLDKSSADVCVCDARAFDSESKKTLDGFRVLGEIENGVYKTEDLYPKIFQLFDGSPWNKMYRCDYMRGQDIKFQNIKKSNDVFFSGAMLLRSSSIAVIKKPYVKYRCSAGGSIQDNRGCNNICILQAVDKLRTLDIPRAARKSLDTYCFSAFMHAFDLASSASRDTARAIYDAYYDHYRLLWGFDSLSPSGMVKNSDRFRFWCFERVSFERLYGVYHRHAGQRYETKTAKAMAALKLLFAALVKR